MVCCFIKPYKHDFEVVKYISYVVPTCAISPHPRAYGGHDIHVANIYIIALYKHQSNYGIETNVYTGTDLPDILRATNEISDWFTLGIFLKVDYSKLKTLQKDYPSDHNHCRQEMLMFWISSGNATWSILVKTLRDDMKEPGLAERIEKGHLR